MTQQRDITDQRFGRLIAEEAVGKTKSRGYKWRCVCDCGRTTIVALGNLHAGNTLSCGCYDRERRVSGATKHGGRRTREYGIWVNMIQRCTNPRNPEWVNYGGRGISVCTGWRDFVTFLHDMGQAPSGHSLDRIDVNGNYCKANCRWATNQMQACNTRRNRPLTFNGKTQALVAWSHEVGINYWTLYDRLRRGWDVERTLGERCKERQDG